MNGIVRDTKTATSDRIIPTCSNIHSKLTDSTVLKSNAFDLLPQRKIMDYVWPQVSRAQRGVGSDALKNIESRRLPLMGLMRNHMVIGGSIANPFSHAL